jgi:hypothetical protein
MRRSEKEKKSEEKKKINLKTQNGTGRWKSRKEKRTTRKEEGHGIVR